MIGMVFVIIWEFFHRRIFLNLVLLVLLLTVVQGGVDGYNLHGQFQVKSLSSPWFSAACAACAAHICHFFRLYQLDKSSEAKVKFRQASNCCKKVLEATKLAYADQTKESLTLPRNLACLTFGELLLVFSSKVNLLHLNTPEVLSSASDKTKLFGGHSKCMSLSIGWGEFKKKVTKRDTRVRGN